MMPAVCVWRGWGSLPQTDSTQSSQDNSQQQQQDGQQYGYSYGQGGFPFNFFN